MHLKGLAMSCHATGGPAGPSAAPSMVPPDHVTAAIVGSPSPQLVSPSIKSCYGNQIVPIYCNECMVAKTGTIECNKCHMYF